MTKSILISLISISCMSAIPVHAQDAQSTMTRDEYDQIEIRERERKNDEAKVQKEQDADQMADLREERTQTKANASEAKRVGRDADDAAKESRNAYRKEKKAQQSRKNADQQTKKAEKAREKSDNNK